MKIYIVTSGEYSDYRIDAVFTDKSQTELYVATHYEDCDYKEIEEWDSDEIKLSPHEIYNLLFLSQKKPQTPTLFLI